MTSFFPGYEAHVEGMTEDQNEARIARNEVAWYKHHADIVERDIEALRDKLIRAEATLRLCLNKVEWLTRDDEVDSVTPL